MLRPTEVREKIAEIDATIKRWQKVRATWTAYLQSLEAEAKMIEHSPTEGEGDE